MKIKVTLGTMQNASKLVSIAESIFLRCGSLLWTLYCGREIHAWSLKPAGILHMENCRFQLRRKRKKVDFRKTG